MNWLIVVKKTGFPESRSLLAGVWSAIRTLSRNRLSPETSSKLLILRKAPAMDPQDAGRKPVGDAEPGHQRHCWWLRHYLSAPSPDSDQSERATCILYIEIVPLNDFLSARPHPQP